MTPEERIAREGLHPSVAATFVYLPDPANATDEEFAAAFPIPKERRVRFYRDWRAALLAQQAERDSAPDTSGGAA